MTKRFLFYLLVATATLCLVMYVRNPALLSKVWLWFVGLFGTIAVYIQMLWKALEAKLRAIANPIKKASGDTQAETKKQPANNISSLPVPASDNKVKNDIAQLPLSLEQPKTQEKIVDELESKLKLLQQQHPQATDSFPGSTIHLLRYVDDGNTTLGLLYSDNHFFCYTLEDAFRQEKIKGKTRIPEGDFEIKYQKSDTDLTLKYREKAFTKGWFTYHLQLQRVPGFEGIYIHSGGDHNDTEGCILVSDGLSSAGTRKTFNNSKKTYELLYKRIAEDLDRNMPVRIRIYDEKWFTQTMIPS
jgi:hypothetical protein